MASRTQRIDLIIGENNVDAAPYGTSFEGVCTRVPHAVVHQLARQGHLAHVQDPVALGRMLDSLAS
ncbi:hypothetical protein ACW0JT_14670 [Arthrobacter sp. SA17]